mmetsp:Transcript_37748/g.43113  ORF Transcript_37748/g.43113 Transcript_37748/m.43113 type:complete len:103 (-) Transcript_37748:305-613(-)|eukprot:CAMPEP_0194129356 /NCGR_PEP_ID=MMETSP0152-20130528/604_1 /TAXON_ID=1049557 /ORGANISM="Thalassiothrix antarctica, Strain L6-D1" /LENGTH=102 /DNA_ID=CAMNT_0038823527 /DNA_START=83 /DNA_END=391 /DNA_ORIENTATION=-
MFKSIATLLLCVTAVQAFSPPARFLANKQVVAPSNTQVFGMFGEEEEGEERQGITRDNEPEEFFSTNTDKMSDEEKIPIALMGLAGISLPFILGLIALYYAK